MTPVTAVFFTVTLIVAFFFGFLTEVTTIFVFPGLIPLMTPLALTFATLELSVL